mgnify:CR=1 FL=1
MKGRNWKRWLAVISAMALWAAPALWAHCDTLDGPVVAAARAALDKGDVTPVLKWIQPGQEAEVRAAFERTLVVRAKGQEERELADMYFFETLVRLHRAGEGAPYTGLKPAGADPGPFVAGADRALEGGSVDALVKLLVDQAAAGVRERFAVALERRKHADESVATGREYVERYVEFVHFVERLGGALAGPAGHHEGAETVAPPGAPAAPACGHLD